MKKQLRPADEAPHLLSAYRQLDGAGKRDLVRRILAAAVERIGLDSHVRTRQFAWFAIRWVPGDDFDVLVPACIAIARSGKGDATQKAAAELAWSCVRWLESADPNAEAFAHVALEYARLDPVFKLAGGRAAGAVGRKATYMAELRQAHPAADYKALHDVALSEANTARSPFGGDGEDLYEKATEKPISLRQFEKLIPPKNPRKR